MGCTFFSFEDNQVVSHFLKLVIRRTQEVSSSGQSMDMDPVPSACDGDDTGDFSGKSPGASQNVALILLFESTIAWRFCHQKSKQAPSWLSLTCLINSHFYIGAESNGLSGCAWRHKTWGGRDWQANCRGNARTTEVSCSLSTAVDLSTEHN